MTRLQTTHRPLLKPYSVILADLAIAAGSAGHSVALCYHEYPAPLLCELWKHHSRCVSSTSVHQIRVQGDIKRLLERITEVRLGGCPSDC